MPTQPPDDRRPEALQLLRALDEWDPPRDGPPPKSTGEANARVVELHARLVSLGVRYRRQGGRYAIEGFAERGRGERLPDAPG